MLNALMNRSFLSLSLVCSPPTHIHTQSLSMLSEDPVNNICWADQDLADTGSLSLWVCLTCLHEEGTQSALWWRHLILHCSNNISFSQTPPLSIYQTQCISCIRSELIPAWPFGAGITTKYWYHSSCTCIQAPGRHVIFTTIDLQVGRLNN